jgi:ACS family tartrate transporter-like MFS transporter
MIPYVCGGIGMVVWGRVSDAMNERHWNLLVACVLSTGGLVLAGYTLGTWWALVGMSLAAIGFYGSKGPFFAMPPMFLSGTALAGAGFACINSIGNLGGTSRNAAGGHPSPRLVMISCEPRRRSVFNTWR